MPKGCKNFDGTWPVFFHQIDIKTTGIFYLGQALRGKEPSACQDKFGDEVGYHIPLSAAGFVRAGSQLVVTFVKTAERNHHKEKAIFYKFKYLGHKMESCKP